MVRQIFMNSLISKKNFLYSFWGIFILGNTFLALMQRSVFKKSVGEDVYHYISTFNLAFLISSFLLVGFIALKLKMKKFLLLHIIIFPTLCLLTLLFLGFFSPFSFTAYIINSKINADNFPTLEITR